MEIDNESENRVELSRQAQAATDKKMKLLMEAKMEKSDEKLDSMAVLMLHYCAGLQHCLDQEEMERVKQQEEEKTSTNDGGMTCNDELEHASMELCGVLGEEDSCTTVEDTHGELLHTSGDGGEKNKLEGELLGTGITESEISVEAEDETVEDVTVVSDNEVVFSTSLTVETELDLRTETLPDVADVLTPSTQESVEVEEESEVSHDSDSAGHHRVTCVHGQVV